MNVFHTKILLYTLVIFKYLPVLQKDERQRWIEYCHDDYKKCPNCFGEKSKFTDFTFLDNVTIENGFGLEVGSLFGNRKVRFGVHDEQKVILKYLISDESFHNLRSKFCNGKLKCEMLWEYNNIGDDTLKTELLRIFETKESAAGFQICPIDSVIRFMDVFSQRTIFDWFLLNLNAEPLIMDTLIRRNFSVPQLHDSCGFVTLQSNNGLPLYSFYDHSFAVRLLIAKNLLDAAVKFSYGVEGFRIYLTDATPDNIVCDPNTFDVTFVDLDNVFVVDSKKIVNGRSIHRHEKIDCDGMCFAYVPEELCSYHLSDINLFAICQLFVDDPNRMPNKGLLHFVPGNAIVNEYSEIQQLVSHCIEGSIGGDRFVTVELLLQLFNKVLLN